ncbi:class I adenylate-forming enzyme family protein [Endozoicomonas ascidiicola]|uniref:class I adenylate-forming enzyme family protein n=1 Tax=Endozoicomonas ascidiicola TaxID=1698521 RepID=UPI00082EC8B1|nr:class I adenylate-forming enzyme family protein [Endozoicomonas ascidiicola]
MIYSSFKNSCSTFANETAIIHPRRTVGYKELFEEVSQVANELKALSVTGSVGIMLPNIPEFISITYGLFANGNVATPLSVLLTPLELKHAIEDSNLELMFVHDSLIFVVEQAIDLSSVKPSIIVVGDTSEKHLNFRGILEKNTHWDSRPVEDSHCLTMYTSGSTGSSKGVMMSATSIVAQGHMLKTAFEVTEDDRILCALPLFHAYGLNALVGTALISGATIVLHDRFRTADCINSLEKDDITIFAGVPTMYAQILDYSSDLEQKPSFVKLKTCLAGGAPMDASLLASFEDLFSTRIYEGYGLTETTVSVCSNTPEPTGRKIGSVGRPYKGVSVKVIDSTGAAAPTKGVGELVFKGQNLMLGYQNLDLETKEVLKEGWLHSGDLGYVDEEGFCFIVGRKKDLIIKSGYNIFPKDVEDAIRQVESVHDVVVFGAPDRIKGEAVVAAVILKTNHNPNDASEQIRFALKTTLAKHKHPNDITFLKNFPLGHTEKVLKSRIRSSYINQMEMEMEMERV